MIAPALAEWGISTPDFPEAARRAAGRHLYDGLVNVLGAWRTGAVPAAVDVAVELGGPTEATVLGRTTQVSAPAAALANGALVHALDFDDTHAGGLVHATSVVLPAALAVGEQTGATGAQVLDAAVVGYETVCRIAAAAPNGFHARGLHATMAAGVFSSALATARLLGLSVTQTTNALGIAGSSAGGLLAFLGTEASTKQLHPGLASHAGIVAARLAAHGATGPETVFDGPHGLYDALTEGPATPTAILADLGTVWETTRIGIKPYPVCQLSHATLDAVLDARRRHPFGADQVARIHARVHPDSAAVVCDPSRDLTRPAGGYAAKFSLPWSVAALVVDGEVGLASFEHNSIVRADVTDLASRVDFTISTPDTVAADAPGEVVVVLRDGTEINGAVPRSAGGPDNPMSDEALRLKGSALAGSDTAGLFESVTTLSAQRDLTTLLCALTDLLPSTSEGS